MLIGDRVVNHVPSRDRDIAMVFQSYALYPHLNVYDIGERQRAHALVTIRRAADHCHPVLFQPRTHPIDVLNDDGELPDTLLRQAEYFPRRAVRVSRIVLQKDVRVLEAEASQVLLFVLRRQAEDLAVEPLRALKVLDDQIDGTDPLLPFTAFRPSLDFMRFPHVGPKG